MNLKEKFKESAKELGNTRSIAVMAMLVAVCIVCEKFLVIPVGGMIKQVKFTIIPATIAGMLFGPVAGTVVVTLCVVVSCFVVCFIGCSINLVN